MALEKAKFINSINNKEINVQFNPSSLTITASALISEQKTKQLNSDSAIINIGGIQSRQLNISLVFDTYENDNVLTPIFGRSGGEESVKTVIDNFENFMNSSAEILFVWGQIMFSGYINNISVKYEMFTSQGVPIRATVDVNMEESAYQEQDFEDVDFGLNDDFSDDDEEGMLSKILANISGV